MNTNQARTTRDTFKTTLHYKRGQVTAGAKVFKFDPHSAADRRRAAREAEAYAAETVAALEKSKGAPLSPTEHATLTLDKPPEVSRPRSLRKEKSDSANPFDIPLQAARDKPAFTRDQIAMKARMVSHLEGLHAKRESQRIESQTQMEFDSRADVQRMRSHALNILEGLKRDPTATTAQLKEAERLFTLASGYSMTPEDYFKTLMATTKAEPTHEPTAIEQPLTDKLAAGAQDIYEAQKWEKWPG